MTNNKVALVTGVSGQDGAYLSAQLLANNYTVYGTTSQIQTTNFWRLDELGISKHIHLLHCDLTEQAQLSQLLSQVNPQQIYHLAGFSSVRNSFVTPQLTMQANALGTLNLLAAVRQSSPQSRLFFASSSEVFDGVKGTKSVDESAPMLPHSPYGISKLAAQLFVKQYRQQHGLHASSGILFNHESPLRAEDFVTRKITKGLVARVLGSGPPVELGNFDSQRDWGSAEDYTQAMQAILHLEKANDFIIASGQLTSVRELLSYAATALGCEPEFKGQGVNEICLDRKTGALIARSNQEYYRANDQAISAKASKLQEATGWTPTKTMQHVIESMVRFDSQAY